MRPPGAWRWTRSIALRAFLLLASFVPAMIAFVVICALKFRTAPRRAVVSGVFLLAFCFFEISYRSIEFFVVDGIWTRTLLDTSDEAVRTAMQARLDVFADVVRGVYFPLMLTRLVGSVFLFATTFPAARADGFLRAATAITALRLTARLASTYAGVTGLSAVNDQLYFPVVFVSLSALIVYLWRADDLPDPTRPAA